MKKHPDTVKNDDLQAHLKCLVDAVASMPIPAKIEALNHIRQALHEVSPFADPIDCVLWVQADQVRGNDYNPNKVAPPEMRLLKRSVKEDGYTQPIVAHQERDSYVVIDGFHRRRVGTEYKPIRNRLHGCLPVTLVKSGGIKQRMAATIRHNRARGVHGVVPMMDVVATLIREGWSDTDICAELGMSADEVLRFKQNKGLPELFSDADFSTAWE